MQSSKGSRRIEVEGIEYRWSANGNDGYISIVIAPTNGIGPRLVGNLRYHETWLPASAGWRSAGDQIVVTPKLIRRIIEHAVAARGYDPLVRGKEINLMCLDDVIKWDDAVRAGAQDDSGPERDPTIGAT